MMTVFYFFAHIMPTNYQFFIGLIYIAIYCKYIMFKANSTCCISIVTAKTGFLGSIPWIQKLELKSIIYNTLRVKSEHIGAFWDLF